jgi:UDP-N-acetylmuramoyl-tripeptide--D-alanyl-D-alanine ligase
MEVPDIASALSSARRRSPGRMELIERADGVTVINDAYNANPDSVLAAFNAIDALAGERRRIVVLGEMAELGETSLQEHRKIGAEAVRRGIGVIVGYGGAAAEAILEGAGQGYLARSIPQALDILSTELRPGDVVLVKASKSIGLQVLARELAKR